MIWSIDGARLGRFTADVMERAPWWKDDNFPSNQAWADHVEDLFEFLSDHSQWEEFLPRLTSPQRRQRRSTLAEA